MLENTAETVALRYAFFSHFLVDLILTTCLPPATTTCSCEGDNTTICR